MDNGRIRILSVDAHALLREGIATVIRNEPDMLLTAEAASCGQALQRFREHRPDVTLMDFRVPDLGGIAAITAILTEFPDARIVLLSAFDGDVDIQRALQAGARAVVLKSGPPREMVGAIRKVHAGETSIPSSMGVCLAENFSDGDLTTSDLKVLAQAAGGNQSR